MHATEYTTLIQACKSMKIFLAINVIVYGALHSYSLPSQVVSALAVLLMPVLWSLHRKDYENRHCSNTCIITNCDIISWVAIFDVIIATYMYIMVVYCIATQHYCIVLVWVYIRDGCDMISMFMNDITSLHSWSVNITLEPVTLIHNLCIADICCSHFLLHSFTASTSSI